MNFLEVKIEKVIPLFTGALCSLVLCALIAVQMSFFKKPAASQVVVEKDNAEDGSNFLKRSAEAVPDTILEIYRDAEYSEWVIDFFAGICSSRRVAQAIMDNTDEFDVPPALAFALSWEESNFNPNAVGPRNANGSIDRGLFQLNNRSFPGLEIRAFFDIEVNSYYGISHLRHCLDLGGSEISALAMYNAGAGRVRGSGTPKVTLDYISRILENQRKIENRFHSSLMKEEETRLADNSGGSQLRRSPFRNSAQLHFRKNLSFTP